jgi:hypothetical protein
LINKKRRIFEIKLRRTRKKAQESFRAFLTLGGTILAEIDESLDFSNEA